MIVKRRCSSSAQHAYRASVYDLSKIKEMFVDGDPTESYLKFVESGNVKNLIINGVTNSEVEKIIENLLNNKNVERIHLFNGTITGSIAFNLIDALGVNRLSLRYLSALDLHKTKLTADILKQIFIQNLPLSSIDVSYNSIAKIPKFQKLICPNYPPLTLYLDSNPGIQNIERLFEQIPNLSYVSLQANQIGDEEARKICHTIIHTKHSLEGLDLAFNQISNDGCYDICQTILKPGNSSLTQLFLQENTFTKVAKISFTKALELNQNITEFKPEYIFEEAVLLRRDYPGKDQLTAWLQQLNLESSRYIFYKHNLSLDGLLAYDMTKLSKDLKPSDMRILKDAISELKNQLKDNQDIMTTIQFQSTLITDITIEKQLAHGNSSVVFSGKWQETIPIIVKQFKVSDAYSIKNEFNILCYLKHPNIINCYGRAFVQSRDALIFERGIGDYWQWKEQFPEHSIDKQIKYRLLMDITRGLMYMKKKRIVHRDLSLRNVVIFQTVNKFTAKLTDFGLSYFTRPSERDPQVSAHCEIPQGALIPAIEASPEATYQHSAQSDVWSLGVLMWEMFEKKLSTQETRGFYSGNIPKPIECPPEIYSVILKCLVVEESGRISVEKIYDALKLIKLPSSQIV